MAEGSNREWKTPPCTLDSKAHAVAACLLISRRMALNYQYSDLYKLQFWIKNYNLSHPASSRSICYPSSQPQLIINLNEEMKQQAILMKYGHLNVFFMQQYLTVTAYFNQAHRESLLMFPYFIMQIIMIFYVKVNLIFHTSSLHIRININMYRRLLHKTINKIQRMVDDFRKYNMSITSFMDIQTQYTLSGFADAISNNFHWREFVQSRRMSMKEKYRYWNMQNKIRANRHKVQYIPKKVNPFPMDELVTFHQLHNEYFSNDTECDEVGLNLMRRNTYKSGRANTFMKFLLYQDTLSSMVNHCWDAYKKITKFYAMDAAAYEPDMMLQIYRGVQNLMISQQIADEYKHFNLLILSLLWSLMWCA